MSGWMCGYVCLSVYMCGGWVGGVYVSECVCMYGWVGICIGVRMCRYIYIYIYLYIYMCVCVWGGICVCKDVCV